jgi:hypothetical protein
MAMMNDDALDREVREALEPDDGAVDRAVRRALSQDPHHRSAHGRRLVMAGALAAFFVGALLLNRGTPVKGSDITRVTNIDDTIVVKPPSGGVWLIGGHGKDDDRLPVGTIVVYRTGESR